MKPTEGEKVFAEAIAQIKQLVKQLVPNEQGLMQSYLNFLMVGKIPDGVSLSQCYKNIIKFAEKKDHGFLVLLVFRDLYRRIFQDENENTEELMPIFNLLLNKLILPRFNMSGRKSCSMEHKVILEQRLLECFDKKVKETDKPKNHLDVQDKIFYRECLYFIKPKKISDSKIMSRVNALELLCEMGKSNELTYKEQNAVDKKKLFASLCGKDKPIRIFDLESEVVNTGFGLYILLTLLHTIFWCIFILVFIKCLFYHRQSIIRSANLFE